MAKGIKNFIGRSDNNECVALLRNQKSASSAFIKVTLNR